AWITTLDVGQGLAVLVRTSGRALLYDAGPAYGPEADSGGRVILPLLRASGIAGLEEMMVTHEDIDHLGGALTVLESLPVALLRTSLPRAHPLHALAPARPCIAGDAWAWDGVRFEVLHPAHAAGRRNDRSCVLRVDAQGASMLLTGDIERAGEAELVAAGRDLRSDALLVPHHGSRSSSTPAFIAAVAPRWAIAAAGYRSRFGHPHPEVLARYRDAGVEVRRTDLDGAVHVRLGTSGATLETERARRPRYWRRAPGV
ncbi:MAG TPA: ComEC/Rec2 family competence protein, partial [Burkholderiales bacterium]|nr:ComEC/Rec2 family competence protein [Burkholderiales bacterium]